jgi:hypothetical protein
VLVVLRSGHVCPKKESVAHNGACQLTRTDMITPLSINWHTTCQKLMTNIAKHPDEPIKTRPRFVTSHYPNRHSPFGRSIACRAPQMVGALSNHS